MSAMFLTEIDCLLRAVVAAEEERRAVEQKKNETQEMLRLRGVKALETARANRYAKILSVIDGKMSTTAIASLLGTGGAHLARDMTRMVEAGQLKRTSVKGRLIWEAL